MADQPAQEAAPVASSSRFKFEGREYEFSGLRLKEARDIQRVTGFTMGQFEDRVTEGDIECIAALIWVLQKRENPALRFDDVDGDLSTFEIVDDSDEDGDEAAPTEDAGEGKDEPVEAEAEPATTAGL